MIAILSMALTVLLGCSEVGQHASICVDKCGDGICQEIVCMAEGCPCAETHQSCPTDCK